MEISYPARQLSLATCPSHAYFARILTPVASKEKITSTKSQGIPISIEPTITVSSREGTKEHLICVSKGNKRNINLMPSVYPIDLLAIRQKSLDRALFLYIFIHEIRSSGVRASITIVHIRKFYKM